jgi:hypothetical protein
MENNDKDAIRKVNITYKMLRGKEVAETVVSLPVSESRYAELLAGVKPESKTWNEIRGALERLTYLQGYTSLGAWSIELTTEA